ncbi:MAG TPA: hypothetical protein PLX90_05540, partial [Anaerolineales bacterium]|nr:hypothetical protein [Anaerolineales bacterium]
STSGEENFTYCYHSQADEVRCLPPLAHLTTPYDWKLLQQPLDLCTEPLASGNLGEDIADSSQACGEIVITTESKQITQEDTYYYILFPNQDFQLGYLQDVRAKYSISDKDGNLRTDEVNHTWACHHKEDSAYCVGPSVEDGETITMQIYNYACNQVATEKTWKISSTVQEPQNSSQDRCSLFNENQIEFNALEWKTGEPFEFYFKIPGGVPGLEKNIANDSGDWEYYVSVGDYSSDDCKFIKNESYAKERLYCSVNIPKDAKYEFSLQSVNLFINGCNQPLFDQRSQIPQYSDAVIVPAGGGGGGGGSSGGDSCPAGQSYHDPNPSSGWAGGCCSDGHFYDYAPFGLNCWENPGP